MALCRLEKLEKDFQSMSRPVLTQIAFHLPVYHGSDVS